MTCPEVAGSSWVSRRPRVDLPHPDSPTNPTVSHGWISKLTPSTALTVPATPAWKYLTTLTTRSSGSRAAAARGSATSAGLLIAGRRRQRRRIQFPPVGDACLDALGWPNAAGRTRPRVRDIRGPHFGVRPFHGHPARCALGWAYRLELGILGEALLDPKRAAWAELATWWQRDQVGRQALDGFQPFPPVGVDPRDGAEQRPGVRMLRGFEDLVDRPLLHDLAGVHHDHAFA